MPCMGRRVDVQEADPPIGGATGAQDIMRWVASQLPRQSRCNRVAFSDSPFHEGFIERESNAYA